MARQVVLALGRLTFALLRFFQNRGVDMTTVDEALAAWTSYTQELKDHAAELAAQLEGVQGELQELLDAEEAKDLAKAEELTRTIVDKINAALEAARNPVPAPPETELEADELDADDDGLGDESVGVPVDDQEEAVEPEVQLHEEPEG